jgi:hypothetical protein
MIVIGERVLPTLIHERKPIYKLNIGDKAKIYSYNHCIYMQKCYYHLCFFKYFYTMRAGHDERVAGGDEMEAAR